MKGEVKMGGGGTEKGGIVGPNKLMWGGWGTGSRFVSSSHFMCPAHSIIEYEDSKSPALLFRCRIGLGRSCGQWHWPHFQFSFEKKISKCTIEFSWLLVNYRLFISLTPLPIKWYYCLCSWIPKAIYPRYCSPMALSSLGLSPWLDLAWRGWHRCPIKLMMVETPLCQTLILFKIFAISTILLYTYILNFQQRKYQIIGIFLHLTDLIKNCAILTSANIVTPEIPILCS